DCLRAAAPIAAVVASRRSGPVGPIHPAPARPCPTRTATTAWPVPDTRGALPLRAPAVPFGQAPHGLRLLRSPQAGDLLPTASSESCEASTASPRKHAGI